MFTQFEEKGKLFSNVIAKKPVAVQIQTCTHVIFGTVHIRPDNRLKDEINQTESFLAVTDASVYDLHKNLIQKCNFIAVNRSQIIWLIPDDETLLPDNTK
jgi:hypothetical protein